MKITASVFRILLNAGPILERSHGLLLLGAREGRMTTQAANRERAEMAAELLPYSAESGRPLLALLDESPVLLIFLRHFGCSFCRQTLEDVSRIRETLDARGIRPVFVHLGSPERAKPFFDYYHLSDVERVSNPDASLYALPVFGLQRKNVLFQLLIPNVWKAWLQGALLKHGIGLIKEDGDQMPGIFYIRDRVIVRAFRYRTIADEPDYMRLLA